MSDQEREFWQRVFVASLAAGQGAVWAQLQAKAAVRMLRDTYAYDKNR
jgi:hypothetical protein